MSKTQREEYGEALAKYGKNQQVIVIDADLSNTTKSSIFAKKYPDRFFNVGIAESNMVSMAAGLARAGKTVFVNTYAMFMVTFGLIAARGLIAYGDLNVKLVGSCSGLSDSYNGPSHQAMGDIAIMRSIPGFTVVVPSDGVMVDWLVKEAVTRHGPMYIRLCREDMQVPYKPGQQFQIGKGHVLCEGSDVTILAYGKMVEYSLKAVQILKEQGISAKLIDMFTIKPLDKELVKQCALETGGLVVAEEHSVIGGLGSAVCEELMTNDIFVPVKLVGMNDCFAESGNYSGLLEKYGLSPKTVADAAKEVLKRKGR